MARAEDRLTVARLCKELGTQRRPRLAPDPDRFARHHDAPPPQDPERWRAGGTLMEKLLTVEAAAERLGTSVRFVRRIVFERRIAYVKLGRHVRIAAHDLDAFIQAGRVDVGESRP